MNVICVCTFQILLESQMFDLESYERQVNDNNKVVQDLKDQIEQHCKTIDQKDKEIRRHKREKDDVRKEVKINSKWLRNNRAPSP